MILVNDGGPWLFQMLKLMLMMLSDGFNCGGLPWQQEHHQLTSSPDLTEGHSEPITTGATNDNPKGQP